MKIKKIFIALLLASGIITLAGCADKISQGKKEKSPFDEEALFVAVKTNDPKYCERIMAEELKKDCEKKVNDRKIYDQALSEKNEKSCNEIQTGQLRDLCTQQLKDEKEEMTKEKAIREKEEKEIKKEAEIEESGKIEDCETLEQNHLKAQCKLNIATKWASEKKDPKYCSQVEESLRQICKEAAK